MDQLIKGGLILIALLMGYMIFESFVYLASAQTTGTVTVTASVPTSVTCAFSTTTTAFGTIDPSAVYTSSPDVTITVSCNPSAGCQVKVKDQGNGTNPGLYNSTADYLIQSQDATLSPGTEGYGIQAATTTAGSGSTLSLNPKYNKTGYNVGGLTISYTILATSSSPTANREVVVTHKAAVSGLTPAGNYQDTITYDCVSN
jgi:hypothetical protein